MSAELIQLSERSRQRAAQHDRLREAIRTPALAMYRILGCEKTWRALYEIADEIVSLAAREGKL